MTGPHQQQEQQIYITTDTKPTLDEIEKQIENGEFSKYFVEEYKITIKSTSIAMYAVMNGKTYRIKTNQLTKKAGHCISDIVYMELNPTELNTLTRSNILYSYEVIKKAYTIDCVPDTIKDYANSTNKYLVVEFDACHNTVVNYYII
jgi:hypothetical protein